MTTFLHCEPSIGWVSGTNHYYAGLAQWLTHTSPPRMPIVRENVEFWVLMLQKYKYSFSTLGSKGGALQIAQKYLHINIKEE